MNNEEIASRKRMPSSLPSFLRRERERRHWSQSELADRLGTNQVSVSRWENGSVTPGLYFRQQLEKLFGKSLEEIDILTSAENEENKENKAAPILSLPSTAPFTTSSLWNVPYHRNPFFTGRDDILTTLYTTLTSSKSAALTQAQAISGLGGIGKTQIAVEYAYRYCQDYQAVLWVTASHDTLITDFVMLATVLNLPEQDEQDQEIVIRAVKRWLVTHQNWLLILDNVDDPTQVANFLPTQGSMGSFLLTTRLQTLGSIVQSIKVEKMERDEGVMFLLRRTRAHAANTQNSERQQEQAEEIVTILDGLPLALDQAAAYIEETQCGFSTYVQLYSTHRKELLQRRGRLPVNHPEPVATTWSLSFRQIEQENLAATDLLRLLAFLNPEAIPEEILVEGASELGPTLKLVTNDSLKLNEVLGLLLRYSLLQRNSEAKSLNVHRLVQAVLKDGMTQDQQCLWAERAVHAINKAFPNVELKTWTQCQRCLPHAQISALYIEEYGLVFPEAARLLNQAANYLSTHAQYTQAEALLRQALKIREQVLTENHLDTAFTLSDLGILYLTEGKYSQAAPLLHDALEIRDRILGREHPDTASSLNNLALLYYAQGKYALAEEQYQQALDIRQRVLRPEHPAIAQSLNNLAELYTVQGKYTKAEALYIQAQGSQQKMLGPYHLDVAKTLNNLALLYRAQGEYLRAKQLYEQTLSIQEQALGPKHPDVAQILHNMARLYRAQGEYVKAEPFYLRALDIREEVFGPDHRHVAQSLYGLAKLYNSQGRYEEAQESAQRALKIQEQRLGSEHLDVAYTLSVLAKAYQGLQKLSEAENLNKRALHIQEHTLDTNHPRIALINNNLVEIYHAQGKYREAEPLIARSLEIHAQALGVNHTYMAYSLSNRAENFLYQGDYAQAEIFFLKVLSIREKNLGRHPRTASTYYHLATLSFSLGRYENAEHFYKEALDIREQVLGPEHPAVLLSLENYAILLQKMGKNKQARELELRAQAIRAQHSKPIK